MPMFQFRCTECHATTERLMTFAESQRPQWCTCGGQLEVTPGCPAWFRSGKYGKAGGLREKGN
jgi:putative FmdB family regulatory protein